MEPARGPAGIPVDPIDYDPTWRKVLTCLPVVGLVMQCVNQRWFRQQAALIDNNSPDAAARKEKLLKKAICYEKCAMAGQGITTLALGILGVFITAPAALFVSLTIAYVISLIPLYMTRSNLQYMRTHNQLHPRLSGT